MQRRALFCLFALVAIALRAVTPSGYMLEADETTGLIKVEICTDAQHSRTSWFNPETGAYEDTAPDDGETSEGSCPFGALTFAKIHDAPQAEFPARYVLMLDGKPVVATHLPTPSRLTPPLRGPPLLV